jgi:hypothetical protein
VFLALHGLNVCFLIALVAILFFNHDGMLAGLHPVEGGRQLGAGRAWWRCCSSATAAG